MWRLKIADGGNDPYIFSTNNFVGRQIWEFDPQAGTPEERAQVEDARHHFYLNRFKVKPCGDLLWRFQILRENNFKQTIPSEKIQDGEEITYQKVTTAVRRGAHHLAALQTSDGHWPAQIAGPLFFLPPLRRLRSYHLILWLGSSDLAVDLSLAADPVHVGTSRAEEIADTAWLSSVMDI